MYSMDWSEFWWSHITGSHMVVSNVVESLLEKSTVVLEVPEDLPWRQEMRSVIERDFSRQVPFDGTYSGNH